MSSTTDTPVDLMELFNTNKESEEDGVWVMLNTVTGFKIRAYSAKAVTDLREKLTKPFLTMQRAGLPIPDEKNEEIGLKVISGAILADWKGVVIEGEVIPFSADAAFSLMKQRPKIANFIASNAMESSNFKDEQREAEAKN